MNKVFIFKSTIISLIIINLLVLLIILFFFQKSQKIFHTSKISTLISNYEIENNLSDFKKIENFKYIINNYYKGLNVYYDKKYFNFSSKVNKIEKSFSCKEVKYNFSNSISIFYSHKLFLDNKIGKNNYKDIYNKRIILIKPNKKSQYKYVFNIICNGYMFFIWFY